MIRVEKDLGNVPQSLKNQNRENAWKKNVQAKKYLGQDGYYKGSDVRKKLAEIYHLKCAFCEKRLLDSLRPVEHFRPKKSNAGLGKCDAKFGYYWLCFSWDNLLLACTQCNTGKSSCFDIEGLRADYENEDYGQVHSLTLSYTQEEQPKLIHPELEDPEPLYDFDKRGEIVSSNRRMKYTIKICKLNRDELVEKRMTVVSKLRKELEFLFHYSISEPGHTYAQIMDDFEKKISFFANQVTQTSEFYAWRKFVWNQFPALINIPENDDFNKIVKLAYLKCKVDWEE